MTAGAGNRCRFCGAELHHVFVDLGLSPLCNSLIEPHRTNEMEPFYPLRVYVCDQCFLVQLEEYVSPEAIFSEYPYFSSFADSWVQHAKRYTDMAIERFGLNSNRLVAEINSNDGYLLQHFVARGIPVLGIEPAGNIAKVASEKGIRTVVDFFGQKTARELVNRHGRADLLVENNVLNKIPNLNDFVSGMKILLKPEGIVTMELPHIIHLIHENQFDTIYHEHYSYFSFTTAEKVLSAHGFTVFDVEEIPTFGGSLRIYARRTENASWPVSDRVERMRIREQEEGLLSLGYYDTFPKQVEETKRAILEFLIKVKREGGRIAGYGAPGKGTTLLNYCGIRTDFLDYTVDRNPYKQGKFTPGTRIPIYPPEKIRETRPDYLFILPWNIKDEVMKQAAYIREWDGKFIVPIPRLQVY